MWRHQPRTDQVRAMLRRGDIGQLRLVRCSFSFDIDRADWRLDPTRGGGSLWDIGCYGVNTCRLYCEAEPTAVQAAAHLGPGGVDMSVSAILEFPGGVLGQVDCSFEVPYRCHYELVGTRGIIEVPRAYLPGESPVILWQHGGASEHIAATGLGWKAFARALLVQKGMLIRVDDAHYRLFDDAGLPEGGT